MSKWDLAADRKLLLTIIEVTNTAALPWEKITAKMGEGFTKEAVRQHFAKLKKEIDPNPTTPVAPKVTKKPKSKQTDDSPSLGRKRKKSATIVNSENEDDSEAEVDAKKAKKEEFEVRRGSIIKVEEVSEDGTINLDQDSLYD